jgi:hypothetical protein
MNQLKNQSGDNGGYANVKDQVLELGQWDSLSPWLFIPSIPTRRL